MDGTGGSDDSVNSDEWLQDIIDTLADAYGWSKRQILDHVYPDEAVVLMERIAKRRRNDALQRIADWELALAISLAPHTKDGGASISRELKQMRRQLETGGATSDVEHELQGKIIELNKRRLTRKEAG